MEAVERRGISPAVKLVSAVMAGKNREKKKVKDAVYIQTFTAVTRHLQLVACCCLRLVSTRGAVKPAHRRKAAGRRCFGLQPRHSVTATFEARFAKDLLLIKITSLKGFCSWFVDL